MMKILSDSGSADDLPDPVSESGDASVDAIVVWTSAAFAPAHHPGQEPATRWFLANQGTTRVSLTETGKVDLDKNSLWDGHYENYIFSSCMYVFLCT